MASTKSRKLSKSFAATAKKITLSDPYDLRPAADAIAREIQQRARNAPVLALMGECHPCAAHIILRQMVMSRLLNSTSRLALNAAMEQPMAPFTYGIEMPHNFLEQTINNLGFTIPADKRGIISREDKDGQKLLAACIAGYRYPGAPVSHDNLFSLLRQQHIPTHPNDLVFDRLCLDKTDPLTKKMLEQDTEHKYFVWLNEPKGMTLRNHFIVQRVLDHWQETRTPVYIQDCGSAHLFGSYDDNKFSNSLTALFAKVSGIDILPVFIPVLTSDPRNLIPEDAYIDQPGLIVKRVCNKKYDTDNDGECSGERHFLEKINAHSGNEIDMLPIPETLRENVKTAIPGWINSSGNGQKPAPSM